VLIEVKKHHQVGGGGKENPHHRKLEGVQGMPSKRTRGYWGIKDVLGGLDISLTSKKRGCKKSKGKQKTKK